MGLLHLFLAASMPVVKWRNSLSPYLRVYIFSGPTGPRERETMHRPMPKPTSFTPKEMEGGINMVAQFIGFLSQSIRVGFTRRGKRVIPKPKEEPKPFGAVFMWAYVYNIVRMYSREIVERAEDVDVLAGANDEESNTNGDHTSLNCTEPHLPAVANLPVPPIVGFVIGMSPPFRKLLIGNDAPLHVIEDAASLLGYVANESTKLARVPLCAISILMGISKI
ncbi:hypothetical protein Cgig2_033692 [Carnegiea gigantea]|uniref:Uncharacterized protein n=1 Tax=Carnegiea gigantea TaxID=171969 RepID=A0A9Q1K6V5_9CARY|nr:hypothetical protein Cgig2_033692 [Carnegiea gigantea]